MMVIISITEKTGLFTFIAIRFAQSVRGDPMFLLIGSIVLTAIGSAFLDNVTTVLIFVPVMLKITKLLKLPAFPYLLMIIFSSNIGGTATLIGDAEYHDWTGGRAFYILNLSRTYCTSSTIFVNSTYLD